MELSIYFRLIWAQIRSQMQYRSGFLLDIFSTGLVTGLGFLSLALIFQRFGNIAGWNLAEVAFLYGMVETAFGIMDMLFSGFDPQNFGRQIRLGRFDQLLLKPVTLTVQVLGSDFVTRRIGRIIQGLSVLIIAIGLLDIHWTWIKVIFLPIMLISLIWFFGGLFMIGATITFWTVESIEVVNIFTYGGSEMMSYPMHIYPDWMRRVFTYIIPAIFLNYYPTLYLLDKSDPFQMPEYVFLLAPVVGFGVLAISFMFWQFGIRHYHSTGT